MTVPTPIGARCFVQDIIPEDELTQAAKRSGLVLKLKPENMPRPTTGIVVAVGNDPLIQEMVKEGDTVFFQKYAGVNINWEGTEFRSLEIHEIICVARKK